METAQISSPHVAAASVGEGGQGSKVGTREDRGNICRALRGKETVYSNAALHGTSVKRDAASCRSNAGRRAEKSSSILKG